MFTGLIEEVGRVRALVRRGGGARITVEAVRILEDVREGDSVAVDGACLTVAALDPTGFQADVSPETLERTTLGEFGPGRPVNLERALAAGGRLGGHLVTGHVDGVGVLAGRRRRGNALILTLEAPAEVLAVSVAKGSVAVDGVSLTLNHVGEGTFSVAVIPHTAARTTLGDKAVGSRVNLESDLIGKYVARLLGRWAGPGGSAPPGIDREFLSRHGFA